MGLNAPFKTPLKITSQPLKGVYLMTKLVLTKPDTVATDDSYLMASWLLLSLSFFFLLYSKQYPPASQHPLSPTISHKRNETTLRLNRLNRLFERIASLMKENRLKYSPFYRAARHSLIFAARKYWLYDKSKVSGNMIGGMNDGRHSPFFFFFLWISKAKKKRNERPVSWMVGEVLDTA